MVNRLALIMLLVAVFVGGMAIGATLCHGYSIALNSDERRLMGMAYVEGKKGHVNTSKILQAILLNETVAGRYGRLGDKDQKDWKRRSYGVMQIQFITAAATLNQWVGSYGTDKNMLDLLTHDDSFNIWVSRLIVTDLWNMYKDWDYVMLAYNVGTGNIRKYGLKYDPNGYLARAYFHLTSTIIEFNKPFKRAEIMAALHERDVQRILASTITYKNWRDYTTKNVAMLKHTVIKGDTFTGLAQTYLGDMGRWEEIQELNPEVTPTKIKIGSTLIIKR